MQRLTDEINKGLSRETHDEAIVKCFTTYVQDLPNGTGKSSKVRSDIIFIEKTSKRSTHAGIANKI